MFLRILFDGTSGQLITVKLRPGNTHSSRGAAAMLRRVIRRIKRRFPDVSILVRADSGFCVPQVLETVEDLFEERGEEEKVWGSMVKQTLKRRKHGFNETYHGFRTFSQLLEEAQERKLLQLQHDEKSGGYIIRSLAQED